MSHHPSWLTEIYSEKNRKIAVDQLVAEIQKDSTEFHIDFIVAVGISGVAIAGIVSFLTGIPLMIVRKDSDHSHSSYSVEYDNKGIDMPPLCNWIFIDDLISSGDTLRRVISKIDSEIGINALKKIYLYHGEGQWYSTPMFYVDLDED